LLGITDSKDDGVDPTHGQIKPVLALEKCYDITIYCIRWYNGKGWQTYYKWTCFATHQEKFITIVTMEIDEGKETATLSTK